ncbi:precorrin-6A reductase [Laedolimicola ammoniilytica]|uniref:Precorrin-6A reductase n=1 Tax=Laedolimicola ammoniilytica TaxID=2981771 RepID=A0ABT2RWJ4_9FIRM|nr:precorrin-6A reductase [Laedolimicola ammoniilytica]MCU6696692.1 precorrin-6A reductase [Laedolimicola ammoniilytica]SCH86093.1 Probable cobalt-precorrin-6Y C(15)-methyltransferase [decarboxylating] [uncultured Clostridium sp.]
MKQVIVFAGTTEGRQLSAWLAAAGVETLCSVATEYGELLVEKQPHLSVHQGRMLPEEMEQLFAEEGKPLVLDVTHPYAVAVSANIKAACEKTGCEYLRLIRPSLMNKNACKTAEEIVVVESVEAAVNFLKTTEGSIFVTTGSKELAKFTALPDYQNRVYARVLATPEVVTQCTEAGFTGPHLICMQGPFSKELNLAMLRSIGAAWMVTKEAGRAGGFEEKMTAAKEAGVKVVLIGRPREQAGLSIEEGVKLLAERFHIPSDLTDSRDEKNGRIAYLVGIGMGTPDHLTGEARAAFEKADCILGSGRMLDSFKTTRKPLFDAYDPAKMLTYVQEHPEHRTIAVALSGDVGFYSGARRLISTFGNAGIRTELITGISSVTYFCSRLQIPWEDVKLMSIHGRRENLIAAVRTHFRTFTLLGGRDNVASLCEKLEKYGFENVKLYIGERLHYPEERITEGTPAELKEKAFDSLCVAIIENPSYMSGLRSCIPDEEFQRGDAPMTKSEVRSLSVAKLNLNRDSIAWDIGAGTGSVTIEMALAAADGEVYAIEKKPAAAALIEENARRFGTPNVEVHVGTAPEALTDLPAPTHAFIGGSSGNMKEILQLLLAKNPQVRVVINAITLETVAEANSCFKELGFTDLDITQIQAAKAKKVGPYEMMMGQNPVYIFAGTGKGEA